VAGLLGVEAELLERLMICKPAPFGSEVKELRMDKERAIAQRDALARELFHRLMEWVVRTANAALHRVRGTTRLGLLDAPGLEVR
jgi:myosin heavy subunit